VKRGIDWDFVRGDRLGALLVATGSLTIVLAGIGAAVSR
jgi:hypothetical protein